MTEKSDKTVPIIKISTELSELNTTRGSIKGRITRFLSYIELITNMPTLTKLQVTELSLKLAKVEELFPLFDKCQSRIEILNSENLSAELSIREEVENKLLQCIAMAQEVLDKHKPQKAENAPSEAGSSHSCCQHNNNAHELEIKLPILQIPKFDGSFSKWLEFKDMFVNLVHDKDRLSNVNKFQYLRSYLEGEAARLLSNLSVTNSNYLIAWNLLCNRFDNKRQLTRRHLDSLINITQTSESDKSLRFIVDNITKNLRALNSLGQPTDHWDAIVIHIVCQKLDATTFAKWEEHRNNTNIEMPTLSQFTEFLTSRADVLEALKNKPEKRNYSATSTSHSSASFTRPSPLASKFTNKTFVGTTTSPETTSIHKSINCSFCNGSNHRNFECSSFIKLDPGNRRAEVKRLRLCQNCLRPGHGVHQCRSPSCRDCHKRHNVLLCGKASDSTQACSAITDIVSSDETMSNTVVSFTKLNEQVVLSTALIEVVNPLNNKSEQVRALLDSGSQSTLITTSLKLKLGLTSLPTNPIKIVGIGNAPSVVTERCVVRLRAISKSFEATALCLVMPELTGKLPKSLIDPNLLNIPADIELADPLFYQPANIDILIGADLFWEIVGCKQHPLGRSMPILRSSEFGWLIAGPIFSFPQSIQSSLSCSFTSEDYDDLNTKISRFWELEEVPNLKSTLSNSELACEQHFLNHTTRSGDGRFIVRLPLSCTPDRLGVSVHQAKKRLLSLENKFRKNNSIKQAYTKFIREYELLGHLSETNASLSSFSSLPTDSYFLCHHAVFKENSESSKIRVVFDGSGRTSTGLSLNDIQFVGPTIQDNLFSILLRFRQHTFVLTGDIEKFFRNVSLHSDDRKLQQILWREDESDPIKVYQLNTVTYGFASSTFLSTRCLWQLGEECDDPVVKRVIQHDFYVDDLATGSQNREQMLHILSGVSSTLNGGCFNLRKFRSNDPTLFNNLNIDHLDSELIFSEATSVLGLGWHPSTDELHIVSRPLVSPIKITKRSIVSTSFGVFDPLGLVSPCTVIPKLIVQKLWADKIDWDQEVPDNVRHSWETFMSNLPCLYNISIPRHVLCPNPTYIELFSFSDASLLAYGACIYLKSTDSTGACQVRLLCSKSKVAPLKPTTIPRLELCGALLAARLCSLVSDSLRCQINRTIHWCDSQVVLSWLQSSPRRLKTFVSNRVGEITELTQSSSWRYVPSSENPADLISRGVDPSLIANSPLWWSGPSYLMDPESKWPSTFSNAELDDLPEIKVSLVNSISSTFDFNKYSSLRKTLHIHAYVLRFISNCRDSNNRIKNNILSVEELNNAFLSLCKIAQIQSFPLEYELLSKNKTLNSKSKLLSLSPFLEHGIIRVGGRLMSSEYSYNKKHPPILSYNHPLTKLIFHEEHIRHMHAGPQLLLSIVRERVWPINGRIAARRTVRSCFRCSTIRARTFQPVMGHLPAQRVTANFPFLTVGIDFAGPFSTLTKKGRGAKIVKSYLCLFVCFRYKCLHLEAVSDLSTEGFIAALHRFVSRRGKPAEIFCDNGRNFVGASREFANILNSNNTRVTQYAADEGIIFKFSPAYGPHFGGIWEAGVRSAKHHLVRVIGSKNFTFEELGTAFAQVEAILNSRPLCPLSSSPDDHPLSPGHFIIGRPLTSLPTQPLEDRKTSSLQRYARLEQARQHFWSRWQREYISELQNRTKWRSSHGLLQLGDLVLIRDERTAPMDWRMGRVSRLYPGPDGVTRVADVTTTKGTYRRPLVRLCPLPTSSDNV